MKNFLARRFSKRPIRFDFKASTSVAGTLWIYQQRHHQAREVESISMDACCSIGSHTSRCKAGPNYTFPLLYTKLPSTALKFRYFVTLVWIRTRTRAPFAIMNCGFRVSLIWICIIPIGERGWQISGGGKPWVSCQHCILC